MASAADLYTNALYSTSTCNYSSTGLYTPSDELYTSDNTSRLYNGADIRDTSRLYTGGDIIDVLGEEVIGWDNDKTSFVRVTEKDGNEDNWVTLPLTDFHTQYQGDVISARKSLFKPTTSTRVTRPAAKASGTFSCTECDLVYNRECNLTRHRKERHALMVKRVKCPYCKKQYAREDNLVRHVRIVHDNEEHCMCQHCGAEFTRHNSLKRHIEAKHKLAQKYNCTQCDKRFNYSWEVKIHLKNSHTAEKGFECDICGKVFKRPTTLREHKRYTHEGFRVLCKVPNCNAIFGSMANFKKHKRENHVSGDTILRPGRKPDNDSIHSEAAYELICSSDFDPDLRIKCHLCGTICYGNFDLNAHYRKAHSDKTGKASVYNCNECSATFKSKPQFDRHCTKYHFGGGGRVNEVVSVSKAGKLEFSEDCGVTSALCEMGEGLEDLQDCLDPDNLLS